MPIHLLGIRHHGPGSCRNVLNYLQELKPDLILLEGPAEAEALVPYIRDEQMVPPVALLAYQPDQPQNAVFYPFAEFSPEWQTLRYAVQNEIPLRFFDLPLTHSMALNQQPKEKEKETQEEKAPQGKEAKEEDTEIITNHKDPFDYLAEATGYTDGESWWEATIEHRKDNTDIFQAVKEAVTALRKELPNRTSLREQLREAWMRKIIRTAQKENWECIAVICGAWHVPALESMPKVKEDNELLKGLPKVKIECTWIPWTYDRLALRSGYGAGIESPGWYHYLWHHPEDDGTLWISQAVALFREKNMDISVAHAIETIRLAQTTAALRNLPAPSLAEFNEAITTVMGFGDDILLQIIKESLIISNRLGEVPDNVPKVPLLVDVEKVQKRLRVPFTAEIKDMTLDLRKPNDLERSIFFHRLHLLEIDWAIPGYTDGKGTFKEKWTLYHKPEQIISIIEKAIWGNTLEEACQKFLLKQTCDIQHIPELTRLLDQVIPANLPDLVEAMTLQLDRLSAASTDILEMMEAVPDLVNIVRYGSVREMDFSKVGNMLHAMIARILAGGVLICVHIDEEAAMDILGKLASTDYAVSTLNNPELNALWLEFIRQVRISAHVHPLLCGYATRLLNNKGEIMPEDMQNTFSFYSSAGNTPADMAYWFEGFLHSSGSILLLDDNLWNLVNNWICAQDKDTFLELLPILKRTFSEFSSVERRKLGEKAKASGTEGIPLQTPDALSHNEEEASQVIPVVCQLLGIDMK
ncbi:DUF5682 family protein [uncultured Phocaeicola sp.]|uniref:DUF5682 family protein n=1 Tax=uncultured Phocaeicola sp. TaxID=990718 RepID=UPI001434D035|nr:DUF5682 family protein [uncultured Phocaeicola sp.]GFH98591.1 hypothetical protein IMSAGC004_00986 [Bacteroidaceae bacterium]